MRHRPWSRPLALLLAFQYLAGCYSWHTPRTPSPAQYVTEKQPKHVRLTLAPRHDPPGIVPAPVRTRTRIDLLQPWASEDSVGGRQVHWVTWNYQHRPQAGDPVAFAWVDVGRFEERTFDAGKSLLAGLGIGLLVAVVVGIATFDPYGSWGK